CAAPPSARRGCGPSPDGRSGTAGTSPPAAWRRVPVQPPKLPAGQSSSNRPRRGFY
ncbi:MAG: hypothetical protein AVDCRST_MAG68-4542, partial [uncultured Gemmatimonadetes bacterium]